MATQAESVGVPKWYWAVAVLALLWMAFACVMYVIQMTMSPEAFAKLPEADQHVMRASPSWVFAAWAIAVWSGLAGAVGLVFRKRWAQHFLVLSVLAVVVQFGWVLTVGSYLRMKGAEAAVMPMFVFLVGLALVWFALHARKRGWIG